MILYTADYYVSCEKSVNCSIFNRKFTKHGPRNTKLIAVLNAKLKRYRTGCSDMVTTICLVTKHIANN